MEAPSERSSFPRTRSIMAGTAVITGSAADFEMDSGGIFINTGTFLAQNNQSINTQGRTAPLFVNNGTFIRNTGTGTFAIDGGVVFNNAGAVNVQTGTLSIQSGGNATGSFAASSGAVLQFVGTHTTWRTRPALAAWARSI